MIPDKTRFPSGMPHLSNYAHQNGLKFGIYSDVGTHSCAGMPGSYGNETVDAQMFAEWGVDYIKMDGCYAEVEDMKRLYTLWALTLSNTKRDMVFECSWPAYTVTAENMENFEWEHIGRICNLWRVYGDISDSWNSLKNTILYLVSNQSVLSRHQGPGRVHDPDMLEIGNKNFTLMESRTQMSIWAILSAPLIMGHDIRFTTKETLEILTNVEVIAIDQDPLVVMGQVKQTYDEVFIWVKRVVSGWAVALFNSGDVTADVRILWKDLGILPLPSSQPVGSDTNTPQQDGCSTNTPIHIRDVWLREDYGVEVSVCSTATIAVEPHDTKLFRVWPVIVAPIGGGCEPVNENPYASHAQVVVE